MSNIILLLYMLLRCDKAITCLTVYLPKVYSLSASQQYTFRQVPLYFGLGGNPNIFPLRSRPVSLPLSSPSVQSSNHLTLQCFGDHFHQALSYDNSILVLLSITLVQSIGTGSNSLFLF